MPVIPVLARANRAFLVDSVRKMAAAGVSQYLDVGSGLPTSPNVHEVARETVPDARVVYVDYDPVVVLHSQAKRGVPGTAAVRADVRSPEVIFASPEVEELIDFDRRCGVLMMSVLHFVGGDIAPLVARYTDRLAPGSFLALSHVVTDDADRARRDRRPGSVRSVPDRPGDAEHGRDPRAVHRLRGAAARPDRRADVHRPDVRLLPRGPRAGDLDALRARPQAVDRPFLWITSSRPKIVRTLS